MPNLNLKINGGIILKVHLHMFEVECERSAIHSHTIKGYVKNTFGVGTFHFHYYFGVSSYLDHTHYFSGFTGKAIQTENGHIHKMVGSLEKANGHCHRFKGYTYEDTAYIPGGQTAGYQI